MFAWCSQKIGSSAAQLGSIMMPPWHWPTRLPPTTTWMSLCGVCSTAPVSAKSPKCCGPTLPPPKPIVADVKSVWARAFAGDVTLGSSWPPLIRLALRFGAARNSGLSEPSGSAGIRKPSGIVLPGNGLS